MSQSAFVLPHFRTECSCFDNFIKGETNKQIITDILIRSNSLVRSMKIRVLVVVVPTSLTVVHAIIKTMCIHNDTRIAHLARTVTLLVVFTYHIQLLHEIQIVMETSIFTVLY